MKINDDNDNDTDGVEQQQRQSIPEETAAAALIEGDRADDKNNKNDEGDNETNEKKTYIKVSADAPWKDRMWEGTLLYVGIIWWDTDQSMEWECGLQRCFVG